MPSTQLASKDSETPKPISDDEGNNKAQAQEKLTNGGSPIDHSTTDSCESVTLEPKADGTPKSKPSSPTLPFPNEITEEILRAFNHFVPTKNCLDDANLRKFIFSLRLVSQTWNVLVLFIFFNKTKLTTGFFPPEFNPCDYLSAMRRTPFIDTELGDIFGQFEDNIKNLHRSDYFLRLPAAPLLFIRTLTFDASCTIGDVDPRNAINIHRDFALAVKACVNLHSLIINCHGMCRLDNPDNGLDGLFTTWNWGLSHEGSNDIGSGRQDVLDWSQRMDKYATGIKNTRMIELPPGPIFPKLKALEITGYTTSTTFSDIGISDLLSFLLRHKETLQILGLNNIGRKDGGARERAEPCDEQDKAEGTKFWRNLREQITQRCTKLKKVDMKHLAYTIVREGPPPSVAQWKPHAAPHHYDWPYETETWVTYNEKHGTFVVDELIRACGCQTAVLVDPKN